MELWIRSQDRESLYKIDCLYVGGTYNNEIQCVSGSLGKYKSKERALEVLDEIQNYISDLLDNRIVENVYEMPKE